MSLDFWVVEWHDRSGQDMIETAQTAEQAIEALRRLIGHQTLAGSEGHGGPAPSAFDELFRGGSPVTLLRHARDVVQHECTNGRFVIRRAPAPNPAEVTVAAADLWSAALVMRPTGLSAHDSRRRTARQSA
jgi:hypothetical protein